MTKADIKTMHRDGESPADCLIATVRSGVEYPDAVWLVKDALKLDEESYNEMEEVCWERC